MTDERKNNPAICDHCGEPVLLDAIVCAHCSNEIVRREPAPPPPPPPEPARLTIRLCMTWIAVIGVVLGLFVTSPPLGVTVCILALTAFIRAGYVVEARNKKNLPTSAERYLWIFVVSFCSLILSMVAACMAAGAFCAVTWPVPGPNFDEGYALLLGLVGLVIGLVCFLFLLIRLWRYCGR